MKALILPALLLGMVPALSYAGDRGHGGHDGGSRWNVSVGIGAIFGGGDRYRGYDHSDFRERSYCPPTVDVRSRVYGPGVIYDRGPVYCPPPLVYAPPVVYEPAPVVCAPPPVVYAAPTVVYAPPPVVYYNAPRVYYPNYGPTCYQGGTYVQSSVRYYGR